MEPQNCSNCGCLPEDILMLQCNHDLCLDCAAEIFKRQHYPKSGGNFITCILCGMITHLDQSSVRQLERIAVRQEMEQIPVQHSLPPFEKFDKVMIKPNEVLSSGYESSRNPSGRTVLPSISKNSSLKPMTSTYGQKQSRICFQHGDQELSYYCFTCLSQCICPECVIHGKHKSHEVLTIKKAYPLVIEKIHDTIKNLEDQMKKNAQQKQQMNLVEKEIRDNMNFTQQSIIQMFQEMKTKIQQKQQELLLICDQVLQTNLNDWESQMHTNQVKDRETKRLYQEIIDQSNSNQQVVDQNGKADSNSIHVVDLQPIQDQLNQISEILQTTDIKTNQSNLGEKTYGGGYSSQSNY